MKKIIRILSLTIMLAPAQEVMRGDHFLTGGITVTIIVPDRRKGGQISVDSDSLSLDVKTPVRDTTAIRTAVRLDSTRHMASMPEKPAAAVQ